MAGSVQLGQELVKELVHELVPELVQELVPELVPELVQELVPELLQELVQEPAPLLASELELELSGAMVASPRVPSSLARRSLGQRYQADARRQRHRRFQRPTFDTKAVCP